MTEWFQPKGGMCMACTHAKEHCKLDFKSMPVTAKIEFLGKLINVVRCTSFERPTSQQ